MAVKICPKCGGKVAESRDTCFHCGYVFGKMETCPECGESVIKTAEGYCPVCGHNFGDDAARQEAIRVEELQRIAEEEKRREVARERERQCELERKKRAAEESRRNMVIEGGVVKKYMGAQYEVIFPEGIKEIGDHAFYNNRSITKVVLPDGLRKIGEGAFCACENLRQMNIPDTVTDIEKWGVYGCIRLSSITIPAATTRIQPLAFSSTGLDSIEVAAGNRVYSDKGNCLIDVKTKTLVIGTNYSQIPNDGSVIIIGEGAFACMKISRISIPRSVKTLEAGAFNGCKSLKEFNYLGTTAEWERIAKGDKWCTNMGTWQVICMDGIARVDTTVKL